MNSLIKLDCFAFVKENNKEYCNCLNNLYCEKGECNFYKKEN